MLPIDFSEDDYSVDINDHMFLPSIDVRLMSESVEGGATVSKVERKLAFGGKYYYELGWCQKPQDANGGGEES